MDKLGRYQIKQAIGRGAMATVYKAFDPEIRRDLAIKVLQPEFRRDAEYRNRFLREAKGAGLLSHPNIVTVFDVGDQDDQPYMAMELVEGPPLSERLKDKKPLPVREAIEIAIQLAKALDYAHRKGIVHRDVKPGNILLVKDAKTIKVSDFGICRIDNTDATQQTQVGNVLGTPHYMSPEQVLGQKVDSRSDLFSAGVVMYQMLTGALPFEGDTLVTVAYKITKTDPVPLNQLRPDLPPKLKWIVDKALKKQPDKRFQSGEELARELESVAQELAEADKVRPVGRIIPLRIRWPLIMAALVALTMTAAAALLYQRQYQAMMDQVTGYGGSLVKLMATQNAVPLLMEDGAAMEVTIQDTISRQDFSSIQVVDHQGIIRGSNDASQIGQPYVAPKATPVSTREEGVKVETYRLGDRRDVLDFAAPILFQGKEIGQVHLGIFQTPLTEVANLTMLLLGVLMLVTSAAVALGSYVLARRLSASMRVLRNSLEEIAKGRYDYRISESRRDEFGDLYAVFDQTAAALQQRHESPAPPAATPSP